MAQAAPAVVKIPTKSPQLARGKPGRAAGRPARGRVLANGTGRAATRGGGEVSGLRWGELTALTIAQIDTTARVITVDRKVVEVAGHLYIEAPKNRKFRRTIYPRCTPGGYPLAERLAARIQAARAEQEAGTNPLGLIFPSPTGKHWRSSNFNRNVLQRAYLAIGAAGEPGRESAADNGGPQAATTGPVSGSLLLRSLMPNRETRSRAVPASRPAEHTDQRASVVP